MELLFQEGDEVYLNSFDYPNACSFKELAEVCPVEYKEYHGQNLSKDKLNVICGSFYMIGNLKF